MTELDNIITVMPLSLGHTIVVLRDGSIYCSCGSVGEW